MSGLKGRSGRKPKSEDIALIEKLTPLDEMAFIKLKEGIEANEFAYLKLYFLYRWGKPREIQEINLTSNEQPPLFNITYTTTED
jgi:hypothetical protein